MTATVPHRAPSTLRHRPKTLTVFAAAFIAGAAVAVGVNRALDVHLAQSKPQVECEPIFVALRSLPQGSPVTVWDVALRDWPKAMVPSTALKSHDTFEGHLLRHPLREGQPLLSVQLVRSAASSTTHAADPSVIEQPFAAPPPAPAVKDVADVNDSWLPGPTTTAIAAAERPTRIATGPQAEPVKPTPAPAAVTPAQQPSVEPPAIEKPRPVEAPKPTEAITTTPAATPQPQLLPAIEPRAISRTDVPDSTVAATPPSPELVPYPSAPTPATPPPPTTQPSAAVPGDGTKPTPAAEPTPAVAATAPASTPSPVEPPSDAVTSTQPTPELKTVLAQNPTAAPRADTPPPQAPGEGPNRYLVVPERIALQADVSFVNPTPGVGVDDPPVTQDEPSSQQPSRPTPQPRQTSQPKSAQKQTASGRQTSSSRLPGRSGPAMRSPAGPRATNGTTGQQPGSIQPPAGGKRSSTAAAPQAPMFPNIAAGIDALTGGFKRARDEQGKSPPR